MSRKHRKSLIVLALIAACSLSLASAQETNQSNPERAARRPDTSRNFTSLTAAVTAGACANRARRAITGSRNSTGGWKCKS